jgi:hypothetical protein
MSPLPQPLVLPLLRLTLPPSLLLHLTLPPSLLLLRSALSPSQFTISVYGVEEVERAEAAGDKKLAEQLGHEAVATSLQTVRAGSAGAGR